jgi:dipeptidyl-peptidase-4
MAAEEQQPNGNPLAWSPDGKAFVYRQGTKLMIFDAAIATSKELVDTAAMSAAAAKAPASTESPFGWQNRHVTESTLQWGEANTLLYLAGGDLFLINSDSGKWEQLTKTPAAEHDPKLSPDGRTVAFRREWDLYKLDLASHKETRLTTGGSETLRNGGLDWVYPEELNLGTAYWWSPDSKALLYLQFDLSKEPLYPHEDLRGAKAIFEPQRYPQVGDDNPGVQAGVVSAAGGSTRWLELGDTRRSYLIPRAGWMPDRKHVYAVRMNRVQNQLELLSVDTASGHSSKILEETDRFWINSGMAPEFIGNQQFLWPSERDGFRHLYLYSVEGKNIAQLTKGPWQVQGIVSADGATGRVFYTSSETSPLERQLFSIRSDGSDKRQLSQGAGMHTISMGPRGPYYLDTFSSISSPPRTTIHFKDNGKLLGVYREADTKPFQDYDILPSELTSFALSDGTLIYGRLIKPAGFRTGERYPSIVRVYGGPDVQSIRNTWEGLSMDQVFAHAGFVVWEMDNRGTSGRGHMFETPVYHKLGAVELADQLVGIRYLTSLGFVDPQRIGITGWSYGGFMTLNAMLNAPDIFRAGLAGAPVTNFRNYDTIYTERYMGLPAENAEGYNNTAMPLKAANLKGKLMIAHNLEDDNVLFQNTMQMIDALERADKQFELMIYPQKTHGVRGPLTRQMNASMLEFFERNLK